VIVQQVVIHKAATQIGCAKSLAMMLIGIL
jgi:hypothetical protein